jgi:serpin B
MRKGLMAVAVGTILVTGLGLTAAPEGRADKADVSAVVKGNNEFAFDLYARLRARDGNLFFSPNSISTALAMTSAGARGDTADEMAKALHFTLPPDRLHPAFAALLKALNAEGQKRGYQLSVANALWGQKGEGFKPDFLKLAKDDYGAGLKEVDFAHDTEAARKEINAWVERQTQDRIKDLLQPGVLDPLTRLVLTNAVYFKGDWSSPFKKDLTREEPFLTGGGKVQAPLMHQSARFKYLDAGALQVLEMPYVGKDLSMVVLLPKKADGLAELEKSLTADKLAGWLGQAREEEVEVGLPKFQATSEFSLKDQLAALGMKKAFVPGAADFSGMNGRDDLYITAVVHKAFVDVNEQGTEAAAATGVVVGLRATPVRPVFRADHPFVFLIRDTRNDSVLFLGRLVNPTK